MADKINARAMAARLSKTLGRPITDKAVRSWVRDHMAAHDKTKHPEYQAHEYGAVEQAAIEKGFKARSANARVQASAKGKTPAKVKTPRKARTVAPVAADKAAETPDA